MIKQFDYLIRALLFFLMFMVFALPSMAERVSSSQTDKAFASALFPGFARPDRHNLSTGIADTRRVADPRFTLKPVGADIHRRNGFDEPRVVDNLFRFRF
jgi:hypothetical protein